MDEQYFTITQHSGWAYRKDPQFRRGLQVMNITGSREVRAVEDAGGLLFTDYMAAENFAHRVSYPPTYAGVIPLAPGDFSTILIGGCAVWVPIGVDLAPISACHLRPASS